MWKLKKEEQKGLTLFIADTSWKIYYILVLPQPYEKEQSQWKPNATASPIHIGICWRNVSRFKWDNDDQQFKCSLDLHVW